MKVYKGDTVKVLYGKDRGRTGVVVRALPKKKKVVVDGVNVYKKNIKEENLPGEGGTEAQIVEIIKPMPVSKVMVICPNCGKPSRVGIEREGGKKYRVCKKCDKRFGEIGAKEVETDKKIKVGGEIKKGGDKKKGEESTGKETKTKIADKSQTYRMGRGMDS